MNAVLESLLYFFATFAIIYIVYVVFINRRKKSKNMSTPVLYLIGRFNLNTDKIKISKLKNITAIMNSFIMAFTFSIIINIDLGKIAVLLISFVIMLILIYSLYEIVGRYLKKHEDDK